MIELEPIARCVLAGERDAILVLADAMLESGRAPEWLGEVDLLQNWNLAWTLVRKTLGLRVNPQRTRADPSKVESIQRAIYRGEHAHQWPRPVESVWVWRYGMVEAISLTENCDFEYRQTREMIGRDMWCITSHIARLIGLPQEIELFWIAGSHEGTGRRASQECVWWRADFPPWGGVGRVSQLLQNDWAGDGPVAKHPASESIDFRPVIRPDPYRVGIDDRRMESRLWVPQYSASPLPLPQGLRQRPPD